MKIESIHLKNFKAFKDAEMRDIPSFCVIVGANGSGKSTIFQSFDFLKEALTSNVNTALMNLGGSRGIDEVRSRNSKGPIEITLKFREKPGSPLTTYTLEIGEIHGRAVVKREILSFQKEGQSQPYNMLDFSFGKGVVVINGGDKICDAKDLKKEEQNLKGDDILAIKGLAQFERFPVVVALGNLIEKWHLSDINISRSRADQEVGGADHLSREGGNLSLVLKYIYTNHKSVFDKIIKSLQQRIPGITHVESKTTEEGRVLLKFQDGSFVDPFLARYVSDGTIKMLAYLTLLYDPAPHPLLCVEEPENQLYPKLLWELAEEFSTYADKGGQVFVSTHSPDFLNAVGVENVFWLEKENGYTIIKRAVDDEQVKEYMRQGDQMGYLWKQGFFGGVDPQ